MAQTNVIAASFAQMREATGAIDWFRNQGIDAPAIGAYAVPPGGHARPPRPGDNQRDDLTWIVSLDLARSAIERSVAIATMRREGGTMLARPPAV